MSDRLKASVLISGTGSNLQALIDARSAGRLNLDITHVISNVAQAKGLEKAASAGITTSVLEHGAFADRNDFDRALALLIAAGKPDLVILAGFMRIIGPAVLAPFEGRMINLHPALLPKYRGTRTYQRAIDAGDTEHGASIHFVTAELDGGPVLSRVVIPILDDDTADSLARRLSPMEHRLLVATVEFFTQHTVECTDGVIRIDGAELAKVLQLNEGGSLDA